MSARTLALALLLVGFGSQSAVFAATDSKASARHERKVRVKEKVRLAEKRATDKAGSPRVAPASARALPGSNLGTSLLAESFNSGIPAGWTVLDNIGSGIEWSNLADCVAKGSMGNFTGGTGDAACVNSDDFGPGEYDTELRTPVVSFVGFGAPATLAFNANFQYYAQSLPERFDVDYSLNGAAGPWTNLLRWEEDHGADESLPGEAVSIPLVGLDNQANVMFRFHYYDGNFDWYAQVDDVNIDATPLAQGCSLICPANITVGTDAGLCSAVVNYPAPTTSGQCGTVTCTPPSGGSFVLGDTLVTCTQQIPALGQGPASCSFNVGVDDDEPPAISCPADIEDTLPEGETSMPVIFPAPTATDNCAPAPTSFCNPASGSSFPSGITPVTCTAFDSSNLTSACDFDVNLGIAGGTGSVLEIPTASSYGLLGLALLLAAAGFVLLRRPN